MILYYKVLHVHNVSFLILFQLILRPGVNILKNLPKFYFKILLQIFISYNLSYVDHARGQNLRLRSLLATRTILYHPWVKEASIVMWEIGMDRIILVAMRTTPFKKSKLFTFKYFHHTKSQILLVSHARSLVSELSCISV